MPFEKIREVQDAQWLQELGRTTNLPEQQTKSQKLRPPDHLEDDFEKNLAPSRCKIKPTQIEKISKLLFEGQFRKAPIELIQSNAYSQAYNSSQEQSYVFIYKII